MNYRLIPFFLGLLWLISSCNNQQIVGQWKRELNEGLVEGVQVENSNWGDITFNSDSTFSMGGDHEEESSNDSIPGWHFGGSITGKWRIEEERLLLKPNGLQANIFLNYEIIKLTNKSLVLLSSFDTGDATKYLYYSRKK